MKKILSLILVLATLLAASTLFASCNKQSDADLKVGVILVGDETEGYTLAHMNGIDAAVKAIESKLNKKVSITYKKKIEENNDCSDAAEALVGSGCTLIISNSYGHQDFMAEVAKKHSSVNFVAMTGDYASICGIDNLYNAFTDVYESRYVSGVVAGMKLKELIDAGKIDETKNMKDGNYKIGYVGAFNYAEVVSGYTAFYLGLKSVVSNITMEVVYTQSWFHEQREAAGAEYLMADGCVIIGQHADSTGAPSAVQAKHVAGTYTNVYCVGYNVDMIEDAKDVILTSATNNWEVYYETLFTALLNGEKVPTEWSEGYSKNAVGLTELNKNTVAAGTDARVTEVVEAIKNGTLQVFDTSKFTVEGKEVTTAMIDPSYYDFSGSQPKLVYEGQKFEAIKSANGVSYFAESTFRAAPYFALRIDGIVELNDVDLTK